MLKITIIAVAVALACASLNLKVEEDMLPALTVDPVACIETNCKNELAKCNATCQQILEDGRARCGTYSDPKNISCWTFFLIGKRNQDAIAVAQCGQKFNCFTDKTTFSTQVAIIGDPTQCAQQKCPNEYAACEADSKCLPAINDCYKKCGTSSTCWTFCLPGKGDGNAVTLAKCAQKNGCL